MLTVLPVAEFVPGGALGSAEWILMRVLTLPDAPGTVDLNGTVNSCTTIPPDTFIRALVGAGAVKKKSAGRTVLTAASIFASEAFDKGFRRDRDAI